MHIFNCDGDILSQPNDIVHETKIGNYCAPLARRVA